MALKVTVGYIPAADQSNNKRQIQNKKQRKFNSYSEDYANLFYIRLFNFSSRLLTE